MTKELTDEQLDDLICTYRWNERKQLLRAVIAADRELQDARHSEELAAYELTISNLRAAHRVPDGFVLVSPDTLAGWKTQVNTLAVLSGQDRRERTIKLKQEIADVLAASPQPAAWPEDSIADYIRGIYDYLASTAPSGVADEAFRLPPTATRAQRALHDAATRYQHTQHSGLARQDSGHRREDCRSVAPQPAAQPERNPPDPADIIAGALGTSRAHAYDLMREACAAAQPAAALTDDEIFLAYTAATGKTLPTLGPSRNDLIAISRAVIAADEAKKGGEA